MVAGIVIGLLQIPSYLLADSALGTSSSYISLLYFAQKHFAPGLLDRNPVVKGYSTSKDLFQIGTVLGIMLGARLSIMASGIVFTSTVEISPLVSFIGGVCLLVGARIAGGCTSGHGISGIARLSVSSFITTAAMFAGAMGYGLLFLA